MKKLRSIAALLLCAALLFACTDNNQQGTPSDTAVYSVKLTDPAGNPCGDSIIVNFVSNGQTVAMQTVNADGVAEKSLTKGDYTVTLTSVSGDLTLHYDEDAAVLTADKTETVLILYSVPTVQTSTESVYSAETGETTEVTVTTSYVSAGYTKVELLADQRNYFYFTPDVSGVYRISLLNADGTVGYYGSPYFIQDNSLVERSNDGSVSVNIYDSMIGTGGTGTSVLVLGIDVTENTDGYLVIERTGDPEKTVADYDWVIYKGKTTPESFTLPAGTTLENFDLTASGYDLVLNDSDGYYHLDTADGPVVYFRLGSESDYLDSIETILESSAICAYYYDAEGNFIEKVSFTDCLLEYIVCMDSESGVYPLTDDLIYIIKERGEYAGWWDKESGIYLFVDTNGNTIPGINTEIAWMFNCCYGVVEEESGTTTPDPDITPDPGPSDSTSGIIYTEPEDNTSAPGYQVVPMDSYDVGSDSGTALELNYYSIADTMSYEFTVPAGQYINVDFYRLSGMFMTIRSSDVYIIYDGQVYLPINGVLSFELIFANTNTPCSVSIGNSGSSDMTITSAFGSKLGDYMNPESLPMGQFTTRLEKGDENGYYYSYTATSSGTLTIQLYSITRNTQCQIQLTNNTTSAARTLSESDDYTVSIDVNAGDVIIINIGVITKNYPASTIVATAEFKA